MNWRRTYRNAWCLSQSTISTYTFNNL